MGNAASTAASPDRPLRIDFDALPVLPAPEPRTPTQTTPASPSSTIASPPTAQIHAPPTLQRQPQLVMPSHSQRDSMHARVGIGTSVSSVPSSLYDGSLEISPSLSSHSSGGESFRSSSGSISPSPTLDRRRLSLKLQQTDEPLDAGVPPPVPPHRILSGQIVFPGAEKSDDVSGRATQSPDSSPQSTEIYTRKCSFHSSRSSWSLSGRSRANSRASGTFPGPPASLDDEIPSLTSDDSSSSELSSPDSIQFALDGYGMGTQLRVVNADEPPEDPGIRKKVPSKAMLAEQAEREATWKRRYQRYGQPWKRSSLQIQPQDAETVQHTGREQESAPTISGSPRTLETASGNDPGTLQNSVWDASGNAPRTARTGPEMLPEAVPEIAPGTVPGTPMTAPRTLPGTVKGIPRTPNPPMTTLDNSRTVPETMQGNPRTAHLNKRQQLLGPTPRPHSLPATSIPHANLSRVPPHATLHRNSQDTYYDLQLSSHSFPALVPSHGLPQQLLKQYTPLEQPQPPRYRTSALVPGPLGRPQHAHTLNRGRS